MKSFICMIIMLHLSSIVELLSLVILIRVCLFELVFINNTICLKVDNHINLSW